MVTISEVWSVLKNVSQLRFEARSAVSTGWNGVGSGKVAVSEPNTATLVFDETGTWEPTEGKATRFKNVFRWSNTGDSLRLEHLRFGADHPVFIFAMALGQDGAWREVSAHVCRDDCYTASLAVEGQKLFVDWSILGPRKQEMIKYVYW